LLLWLLLLWLSIGCCGCLPLGGRRLLTPPTRGSSIRLSMTLWSFDIREHHCGGHWIMFTTV